MIMSDAKKNAPVFEGPMNDKIQRKFNLVFGNQKPGNAKFPNENNKKDSSDDLNFDSNLDDVMATENGAKKKDNETVVAQTISLDLADSDAPAAPAATAKSATTDFSFDFNLEEPEEADIEAMPAATQVAQSAGEETSGGFVLDDADLGSMEFDESTKQTVVVNLSTLQEATKVNPTQDNSDDKTKVESFDLMSTAEAKANIESTIKDILRPKFENTQEINISDMALGTDIHDIEDSILDLGGNTPSQGFNLNAVIDDGTFSLEGLGNDEDSTRVVQEKPKEVKVSAPPLEDEEFSLLGDDDDNIPDIAAVEPSFSSDSDTADALSSLSTPLDESLDSSESLFEAPSFSEEDISPPVISKNHSTPAPLEFSSGSMNTEDSMRFQATIRSLREERETLLAQIKNFKTESRELEQDNLTLKANLDEAKIEITILRKRHMVEIEDIKYRLTMSEEKKSMAEEKARQSEARREKLEQKVRIDFNQVKQREKELESKLELLSMDVDSQVQSRDHKILELRRKIDALEFNMENASIKEQKSLDDKRKLEDRLNKIMKTLRHSIKNLEDDIDHAVEDGDHQKDKN